MTVPDTTRRVEGLMGDLLRARQEAQRLREEVSRLTVLLAEARADLDAYARGTR